MSVTHKLEIVLQATTDAFDRGLKKAHQNLTGFQKSLAQQSKGFDNFNKRHEQTFKNLQTLSKWSAGALLAVGGVAIDATREAIKFEAAMAGVKKVVDFDTPQAFKAMEQDILKLSQTIPIAADGLAEIMANAGQAGIAQNELLQFTETAAKMATAFDITADQAGKAMAEMRVAFKMNQTEVETLADKINYLGNTTPNSADKIMQVVQRIGSLGGIAGVSADQIAALAGSITAVEPEVAATGLKNMMLALTKSESATKSQRQAFESLGLSVSQIAKDMQSDSMGTLFTVIERIKALPQDLQVATINNIFGSEALPVISQLVTNTDMLKTNLQAMGDSSKYAGSMLKEFESMAGTSKNQIQLFSQNITAVKIALGSALLPTINSVIQALTPLLQRFAELASTNPKLVSQITIATTAILGLGVAIGAIGIVVPALVTGFSAIVSAVGFVTGAIGALSAGFGTIVSAGGAVIGAITALTAPMLAVVAAIGLIATAGYLLIKNWDDIKGGAIALKNTVSEKFGELKAAATSKLNELKASATAIFNGLPAPLKAQLSVMGSLFSTQFALIKNTVQTAFNIIKALVRGDMQGVANAIRAGLSNAVSIIKSMVSNIVGAFKNLGSQLMQAGRDAIQGFINGVKAKMSEALATARQMASSVAGAVKSALDIHSPSRVMKKLGGHTVDGLTVGIEQNSPKAVKAATKLAEDIKKAVADSTANLRREIALFGDDSPINALQYDIGIGKYQGANTAELEQLTAQKYALERNKIALDEIDKIKQSIATHGMNAVELLQWEIDHTNKYKGIAGQILDDLKAKTAEQLAFNKALEEQNELAEQQAVNDKALAILNQKSVAKSHLGDFFGQVANGEWSGLSADTFAKMQEHYRSQDRADAKNAFDGLTGQSELDKLRADYEAKKAIIDNFQAWHTDKIATANQARLALDNQYAVAVQDLELSAHQNRVGQIAGFAKDIFGENSRAYKTLFAMEKGMALARVLLANKTALAQAYASAPFPQNLAAVAKVAMETGVIASAIGAIKPVIGQAHDGIMSVPKSGTWNLEKGERVLPKHTAQNLDDKLNRLSTTPKIVINNYTGEQVQTEQAGGELLITIGAMIDTKIAQYDRNQYKQGGAYAR